MSYRIKDSKQYSVSAETLQRATMAAIDALAGKVDKQDASAGTLTIKFHKTILGKVLGDRTQFDLTVAETSDGSELSMVAFPLDAIGRELMFGARKGVTQTVKTWLFAHIDNQLSKIAS